MIISRSRSMVSAVGLLVVCAVLVLALHFAVGDNPSAFSWSTSAGSPAAAGGSGVAGRLGSGLDVLARRDPTRQIDVIVHLHGDGAAARQLVTVTGGRLEANRTITGGFAARMEARAAVALAHLSAVRAVSPTLP